MKKTVNVICVFLIALALITGYYTVTNSKNSTPNFNPNNMEKPPEKPDDNQNNMNDSTKDENTNSSVNEDTNANDSTKKDMNANDNSNFNPNNMEKPPTSNGLSTNNLIILGICTFVLITSLSIIVINLRNKKLNKEQKMILVLSLIIISFTLTICLKLLLNKYYYTDQKQDNMIENQNQQIATSGVVEISEEKEESNKNYTSNTSDKSTIVVSKGGNYFLTNSTISKEGDTTNTENSEFYGLNAAVLVKNSGILSLSNSKITTKAKGANAIFATNSNSKITVSDTTIETYNDSSRGLDATYGGEITASNMKIYTRGNSSATLATDRGEGTVTVSDSNLKTEGKGLPIIYSTGKITLKDSEGLSTNSQAVVIEGKNSASLTNTKITTSAIGNRNSVDNAGVMIYQSMSGDASVGKGEFTSKNSSIIVDSSSSVYKTAPMFFITNTKSTINLENTTLTYGSNILLSIKGTNEWGNSGSNGGDLELNATNQKLSGDIILDSLSSVDINLKSSTLTSTVNNNKKAKEVNISIDKNSKWNVEGNSYINTLKLTNNDLNLIKDNGHNVYYDKEANERLDGKTYTLQDGGKLIPR